MVGNSRSHSRCISATSHVQGVDKYSDAQAKAHGVSEKPIHGSIIITSIHRESVVVNRAGARKKKEAGKKLSTFTNAAWEEHSVGVIQMSNMYYPEVPRSWRDKGCFI